MNISVPDDLASEVRGRHLPVSRICQDALRAALGKSPEPLEDMIRRVVREELEAYG